MIGKMILAVYGLGIAIAVAGVCGYRKKVNGSSGVDAGPAMGGDSTPAGNGLAFLKTICLLGGAGDVRDKKDIYQKANSSFDFDYRACHPAGGGSAEEAPFADASRQVDADTTYEFRETDYFA